MGTTPARRPHPLSSRLCRWGACVLAAVPGLSVAQLVSDATRLGAFAGAMQFCEQRYDGPSHRYRWARLRVAQEVSDMGRDERLRALIARDRAREHGRFLGNQLDQRECEALLRMSEWQRFRKP